MILAHRIRLVPTVAQEVYFTRACGVARFAYNWALAEWRRQDAAGQKPSEVALRKHLNTIKHEQFPWMLEVTKNAPQQAIKNLGRAYGNFFDDLKKYRRGEIPWKRVRSPRFKRKGQHDGFRADNGPDKGHPDAVQIDGKRVKLAVIGWVKMREEVRFAGRILSVAISRQADAWFASLSIEIEHETLVRSDQTTVGVDLGIIALATLSDDTPKTSAPKPLRRYLHKLKRLCRALSRKQRGSRNRAKAKTKLARLHRRIHD
ncbi:MAG: RNA-guided endonuclease InsQ/TnpB family protein, partial [Vulcanimicrobiaceae bacterium]